jgi:hypothetical protein
MKKVIRLTENDLVNLVKRVMNEQAAASAPTGTTSSKAWEGLKARLKSAYYYEDVDQNKLTFKFDKWGTATVTYIPSTTKPGVGTLGMEIKFDDPNVVKQNGPIVAKIQSVLGTRFNNNLLTANRPQGYLTQNIDAVANMLFNNIKFNGKTWVNTPSDVIVDKGEIDANDFSLK